MVENCETCKGITNDGKFCSICGENLHQQRFTAKEVLYDVPNAVISFDRGLFRTFRMLSIRPGETVRKILAGLRIRYYKPLNFIFLMGVLYTLLFASFNIDGKIEQSTNDNSAFDDFLLTKSIQWQAFLLLIQIPVIALSSWFLFRKKGLYYGEHIVANSYMVGEVTLFPIIMFPLYLICNNTIVVDILNYVYLALILFYATFFYYDWLFERKGGISYILKCFGVVIISVLILAITFTPMMIILYKINVLIWGK